MNRPSTAQTPSAARLRRLALRGQGLGGTRKLGAGLAGAHKALERIGYVQIDTISVVARAHHHVLFTRVSRYREDMLDRLVRERRAFEYWRHAAAYMPLKDYRFSLPMMRNIARGELKWFRDPDRKLMARVKDRIREEGPLFARDFEDTRASREGWWDWKPAKRALEQLFMEGTLTSVERQGFQKRYDLMERFLPGDVDTSEPGDGEYADHVIDRALRAHGFATRRTMTWLCRDARLRKAVAGRLPARVGAGELDERRLGNGEPVYALPGAFDRHVPAPPDRVRLLSPFDNTVIQRDRCAAVFGFDYTIECYVPEAKRRFGYYALPILFRDRLVGRMDCKACRGEGRFEIKALFIERDVPEAFFPALAAEVSDYAAFTGCAEVGVIRVIPGKYRAPVRRSLDDRR